MTFTPRSDDIYLATYPRSGTSLVQMILYQLTTDGEIRFGHISEVIPFLERSLREGDCLERLSSPRIFKTHWPYGYVSRWPGKYIYVARDGKDVLVSYYHLYRSHVNPDISFADFFEDFLTGRVLYGSWFQHVAGWRTHKDSPRVLYLTYEDLVTNIEPCVDRIAAFIDCDNQSQHLPRILERCGFSFMQSHESKFAPAASLSSVKGAAKKGSFIRRGQNEVWKEYFTKEQEVAFERVSRESFG